jgi:outer membrane protein assembly factor BamB
MNVNRTRSMWVAALALVAAASTVAMTDPSIAGAAAGSKSDGWSQPGFNGAHTAYNATEHTLVPAKIGRLTIKWAASPPAAFTGGGTAYLTAVQGQTLYTMGDSGIRLYSMKNGHAGHHYKLGEGGVTRQPPVLDGKRLIASSGSNLVAVNASTGKRIWTIKKPHTAAVIDSWSNETLAGEVVYATLNRDNFDNAADSGNSLLAISAATGHVLWSKPNVIGPIAVGGGDVYAQVAIPQGGFNDYEVTAFATSTGAVSWTFGLPTLESASDYAYSSGTLFVGGGGSEFSQDVFSLATSTGALNWSHSDPDGGQFPANPAGSNLITDGNMLLYISSKDHLLAVRASTGQKVWQRPAMDINAIGGGGVIYAGSDKHDVAYRLSDGKKLWGSKGVANYSAAMLLVADGRLLVAGRTTRKNEIQAYGRP